MSIYTPNGPNVSISNTNNALILQGAAGGSSPSVSQFRLTANYSGWTDNQTSSYFQVQTLSGSSATNYLTMLGGTYGTDAPFSRLQFLSNYSTFTNVTSFSSTPIPTHLVEIVNNNANTASFGIKALTAQTSNYFDIVSGSTTVFYINNIGTISTISDVIAYNTSDNRFKTNITPIKNPIDKIKQISGVEFDWIPNEEYHSYKGHDVGVIAQEIEKVLPEVVTTRDNGYKAVKYDKIVSLLIEAIKDQQQQIDELKSLLNK